MQNFYRKSQNEEGKGFQHDEQQNRNGKLMPILVAVLIIMILLLLIFLGCLFMRCSSIAANLKEIKFNVSNLQKAAEKQHNDLEIKLKANSETLEKLCKTCPRGWIASANNCYYFSSTLMTWDEARSECNKFSSDLVTLSNKNETDAFNKLFRGSSQHWIGLRRDKANITVWKWVDETEVTFPNWNVNEPNFNRQREYCGENISGLWNDRDCSHKVNFVCKKVLVC